MTVGVPDIQAADDVVKQLLGETDTLGADEAIRLHVVIASLMADAKLCHELLEAQALKAMDGQPVKVGDETWISDASGKWRAEHSKIKQRIVEAARHDENGARIGNVLKVARNAVELTYALFVSPADFPKQRALEQIKATNKTVGKWEVGRDRLKLVDKQKERE